MTKVKQLSFAGETIYVGLDVHKKSWKVQPRLGGLQLKGFSQDPNAEVLSNYFKRNYPGATIKVVYEAGFCGFNAQRDLSKFGIDCIVVNAADVPTSDKERKRKDDQRDANKLSRQLAEGNLTAIYVPDVEMEYARSLVRQHYRLIQDQTRCKNRLKHLLMFHGIKLDTTDDRWSKNYIQHIQKAAAKVKGLQPSLMFAIEEYIQIHSILKQCNKAIRQLSEEPKFAQLHKRLRKIPGLGLLHAMVVQTEIQEMKRFRTLDKLCDYVGFVPDMSSSGEKTTIKGVSERGNSFLRNAIIESSWTLVREDPALQMKYNEYLKRMNGNKAIIRIAKHLLARIRIVWNNDVEYQTGVVA